LKKLISVSRARLASSDVGELGADEPSGGDWRPDGVLEEGGAMDMEPLLLLWCNGGDERAELIPNGCCSSWIGESNAEGGAVIGIYFGVRESLCCEIYDGSIFRLGNV